MTGLRNLVIVLALAAAAAFVPGGGTTSQVVLQVLAILFLAGIGLFAWRLYRENRVALYSLGDRNRATLYGSVAVAVLAVSGTSRLWGTSPGIFLWFVLVVGATLGVLSVFRATREY